MSDTPPKITISDAPPKPERKSVASPRVSAPKTSGTGNLSLDVKKAMATLESGYNLISMGLLLGGLPESAIEWNESAENLKATNAEALSAAPKLAKAIASAGGTGGSAAFIVTHGMALLALSRIATAEITAKRKDKPKPNVSRETFQPEPDEPRVDPTRIPGT